MTCVECCWWFVSEVYAVQTRHTFVVGLRNGNGDLAMAQAHATGIAYITPDSCITNGMEHVPRGRLQAVV